VDTVGDVLQRRTLTTLDGFSQWDPASGLGLGGGKVSQVVRSDTSSWSFGAWFVTVTVDPDLGLVRVERMSGLGVQDGSSTRGRRRARCAAEP
jgi:hypothetical protein